MQDAHITITGGTNTVEGGATGGVLEVLAAGAGLEFGGTANPTLTLNSDNAVAGKLLLSGDVTVLNTLTSGTALILSGGGGSNPGTVDLNGGTRTFTINDGSGVTDMLISARIINGALTKAGAGTLSLSGTNTYTGTTSIQAGTLSITGNINSSATLSISGGVLSTSGADKLANAAAVTVGGGTLTIGGDDTVGSLVLTSGTIGGSATLTAATYGLQGGTVDGNLGAGTINSSGNVALNGTGGATTVNVSAGTLTLGAAERLDNSAGVNLTGGTLAIGANNEQVGVVTLTSGSITGSTGVLTGSSYAVQSGSVSAILGGTGVALTKTTAGTVTLSGANTYTGNTSIQAGTLSINAAAALGGGGAVNLGVASTSSGTLTYTGGAGAINKNINALGNGTDTIENAGSGLLTLSGTITKNGTTLTLKGGANGITVSGAIGGASANSDLIVDGGIVTLAAANTYNGPTFIRNGGTLNANAANALPTLNGRTAVTFDGAGTSVLSLGANQAAASLTSAGAATVTLNANILTVGAGSGTTTFAGSIGGTGGFTKDSASTQILSGSNGYSGTTTISAGTLSITGDINSSATLAVNGGLLSTSGANKLSNTAAVTVGGGTLTIGGNDTVGSLTLTSGTIGGTATLTAATYGLQGGFVNGNLGAGILTKSTGGTVTLTGTAAATTVNITGGTLTLGSADRLVDGATVTVSGTGILDVSTFTDTVSIFNMSAGSLNGSGTLTATTYGLSGGTVTANLGAGTINSSGTVALNGTAAATAVNVTAGALTLGFSSAISSATTVGISGGSLTLGASNQIGNGATVTVSGGTLAIGGRSDTVAAVVLTAGSITGSGGTLTSTATHDMQAGSVSAILGGTAGLTKTTAGTVTLSGVNSYSGATTVDAGTLSITGRINSSATIAVNGGLLSTSGANRLANTAAVTVGGGTLTIGGNDTVGSLTLTSGTIGGTATLTAATYGLQGGFVNGNLGAGILTKSTGGTVTLTGTAAATTVNITGGTLTLGSADRLVDGATVTVSGTGILDVSTFTDTVSIFNMSAGSLNGSGTLTATTYGLSGGTVTANLGTGTINSSGNVALNGTAAATAVNISAGTLTLGSADRLADGATVSLTGGTLAVGGFNDTVGGVSLTSGSITGSGGVLTSTTTYSVASGSVSAILGGTVGLTKTTGGTVTLSGVNTYTGATTISAGTLALSGSGALSDTSAVNVNGATGVFDISGISGAGETIGSLAGVVSSSVVLGAKNLTAGGDGTNTVFAGGISGTGSLTKAGTGTLTLNSANGYSGLTTVSAGILNIQNATGLGTTAAGTSVSNGATLQLQGGITVGAEALTLNGGAAAGESGALVNVSGTNSFGGAITVAASSSISATGGSVLNLTGGLDKNGTVLTFNGGGTINVSTVGISGAAANSDLVVDGVTVNLDVANTYNGPTFIRNTGTLNANVAGALPTATRTALTFDGAGTSILTLGADQVVASLTSAGAATITLNTNTLTIGATAGSTTFAGAIGGTGGLIKDDASTQILSGSNGYSGATTISAGTLSITGDINSSATLAVNGGLLSTSGADKLSNTAAVTVAGGTLTIGGDDTVGTLTMSSGTIGGSSTLTAATYALSGGTVNGNLGAGALTSSGNVALNGTAGAATVNITAGTLTLGANDRLSNSATVTVSGGTLAMVTTTDTVSIFNMSSGSITGSGTLTATTYGLSGGTVDANLGTGTLNSSGNVALNGTAGATTVNITAGTLTLGSSNRLDDTAAVIVNGATATLDLGANNDTVGSVRLTRGTIDGSGTLTSGTTFDVRRGTVNAILGGSVGLTKTTGNTVTLTNANTYTGTTTVSAGILGLSGAGRLSDSSSVVVDGGTFDIGTVSDTVAGVQLVSGNITGSTGVLTSNSTYDVQSGGISARLGGTVGLTKTTGGTVTLSGTNSYTGATLLSAGTLAVDGSIGSSSLTTINGGTLQGTGTVSAIQLNSGGAINPGRTSVAGTLNTGSIAIVDGQLQFNIGGTGSYDQINTTGTINLAAGGSGAKLVLDAISGYNATLNDAFTLVSNNLVDAITGKFAKVTTAGTNVVTISGVDYVQNVLGSNYYGRINYAGESTDAATLATAGNDIVLKIVTPEITVTEGATTLTDNGGYDFGDVDKVIPAIPVTKTFTIKNDGEVDLMNIAITALTGVAAGDYSLNTTGTATNLIPGASTTFTVTFDPQRIGTRNAYFSITSNDLDEATFDIPLTGVGSVARDLIADGPAPTDSWALTYSGVDAPATLRNSVANAVVVQHSTTADEAMAVFATGYTTNAAGNKDIYVMKYDPNSGADAWAAPVIIDGGVGRDDETLAIAVDGTGHVVVAGYQTVDLGNQDVYVAKFDGANGNLLWSRTYSGAGGGNDAAVSLALDPSGNVAVAGYGRNASANQDVFMARYLADGTEVFAYLIDGGASRTDGANTVATDAAGNVYAAGYRNVAAGNKDCYILAMDSTGGFLWEQTIGGTSVSTGSDDEVYSMALDATGNPVLGGTMYNSTGYDLFAAKLSAVDGSTMWQRSEDPYGFNDSFRRILVDRNGDIVMAGVSHVTTTTTERYVSKYDTNGVLVWNARLNMANSTTGNLWTGGIALDGEENVVVTGFSVNMGGTRDVYTAKLKGRDGSQLWERTYDGGVAGGADDEGFAVASSLDGYVYVAGYAGVDGGTRAALLKHYKPLIAPVQMPQTITFPALAEQGVGGQVQLVATATSGLRVRFNVISGPGTLSGADNDLLTITGLGTVVVRASQTGNFEWAPAANVEQTLNITKQAQTITFTLPASTYYTNVVALGATASSGLAVSYSVVSDPGGVANIVGSDLSFSGPGFVTVRASQAGNGTFVAAPNVDVVIEATNTPPVIFPSDIAQRWANTFAGTGAGAARAVALKPATGAATSAVITGYTTTAGGGRDIYTAQYNASGGLDWQATYTGAGVLADEGVAVTVDAAGNVYVAGYTTISGAGTDVIVIKYNSTGAEQWVRTFAGSTATGADAATSLALVGSDVVVGGYLTNATRDFFAARITGANAVTWQSSYDAGTIEGSTSKADTANKVAVDSSENIALVGNSASSSNNIDDIWTVKLDGATGTRQWHKRYNGTLNREDRGNGVGFDNVGNVLITGWTNGQASSQTYDIYTAKYAAADGALVWQTTYNGPNSLNDSSRDMKVDSQGSVIVVGVSNNPQGNQDMWTGKFNGQTGALVWEMVYNNNRNDVGLSVSLDPNGNPVVTGSSADVFGSVDIYTVKYSNANGTPVWDLPGFQRYEAINGRSDAPAMVAADGAGSVYVAGHHANSSGVTEALLVRYAPATVLPPPPLPPPPAFGEEEVFAAAPPPPPALQLFMNVEHGDLAHFGAEFSDAEGNDTVDFTATINGSPGGVLDVDAPAGRFTWEHDTSSIAPGLHEVVITATDTAGASSSVNLSVTVESNHPDRTWRWENFGSTVATGNAADDADPDGDGLSNLAEFAFGLNPTRAGNDVGTRAEAATEVGSGMRAVFRRRKDHATAGIDYVVEFSSNLGDWTPSTAIPELIADEGILERVGLVFPVLPNGKQSRFFRIQVQQQNAPSQ